jgi:signal transduction histidine kinase
VSVLPLLGPDAQVEVVIGVGADVTLVGELERQLHQASRLEAIGQLAAGNAHEINTPIQFVSDNVRFMADSFEQLRGLIDLMQGISADADAATAVTKLEQVRDKLEEIDIEFLLEEIPRALGESLEGLERVAQIVRAMRDFSHPGQGRRDIDINRAIESTVQVARNEWKYHAELALDLSEDVGEVPCYEGEFKQVILNLIVNAAHAIDSRRSSDHTTLLGHIKIITRRYQDHTEVRVSDDGTGMPTSVRERIFDPFFTTKEVGKGTGQGLSMAYATIVQKHGGTIRVESEPGQGATFIIRLPLEYEPAAA